MPVEWIIAGMFTIIALFFVTVVPMYLYFGRLWFRAHAAGSPISILELMAMALRKSPPHLLVPPYLEVHKAGLDVPLYRLEELHRGGARVREICRAAVLAKDAERDIPFDQVATLDLQGVDVLQHVKESVEAV